MIFTIHNEILRQYQKSIDKVLAILDRMPYDPPDTHNEDLQRYRGRAAAYLDAAHVYRGGETMLIDTNIAEILQQRIDRLEAALDREQAEEEPDAAEIAGICGQIEAYYKTIKLIKSAERAAEEG